MLNFYRLFIFNDNKDFNLLIFTLRIKQRLGWARNHRLDNQMKENNTFSHAHPIKPC